LEGCDEDKPIDVDLTNVTLWEALDTLARVSGTYYDLTSKPPVYVEKDGKTILKDKPIKTKIVFRPGTVPQFPVRYFEQFRISIAEAKRIRYLSPDLAGSFIPVVLEVRHQPNMKPIGDALGDVFKIASVKDANGKDVMLKDRSAWARSATVDDRDFSLQDTLYVDATAEAPLAIEGTTDIPFPSEVKEIPLAVAGENKEVREGMCIFRVNGWTEAPAGCTLTLQVKSEEPSPLGDRLQEGTLTLVDGEGATHAGYSNGSGGGGDDHGWNFSFPAGIKNPQKVTFRWVTQIHRVEISFRLEGVSLP
jgi:hypothetical protein